MAKGEEMLKPADKMFSELGYKPVMKCSTRRTYQKVGDSRKFDIIVDKKKIWKVSQNIFCPSDISNGTWWQPEELLAASKAFQEMEEEMDIIKDIV